MGSKDKYYVVFQMSSLENTGSCGLFWILFWSGLFLLVCFFAFWCVFFYREANSIKK